MLYIAYGSNINREQMKARCPNAKIYGQGVLNDYRLEFHGIDGDAKATVVKAKGEKTPIVIWEFSSEDEKLMDRFEGFPQVYFKKKICINISGENRRCLIYIKHKSPIGRPSRKYVNTIRWGYEEFHLKLDFLLDALQRNSEEFYADNIYEVRSIPVADKPKNIYPIKLSGINKVNYAFPKVKPYAVKPCVNRD